MAQLPVPSQVPATLLPRLQAMYMARLPRYAAARFFEDLVAPVREAAVDGRILRYHPTQLPLARWVTPRVMTEGVRNFSFGRPEIRLITPEFDIRRIAIEVSPIFPQLGKVLATEDAVPRLREMAPVDRTEVVEWMHDSAAALAVMSAREVEYNKHSQVETRSGDAFIPGVRLSSLAFERVSGYTYWSRGYARAFTPVGTINVPRMSLTPIIGRDFLGWAFAGPQWSIQWTGVLAELKRLADRITSPVGFPNLWGRVAPFWVLQQPNRETRRAEVVMVIDSDRPQRMRITFRDPNNYTRVIDAGEIDVPRGRTEIRFVVASYPAVPPVVNEMRPEDGTRTVLNRFETRVIS